MFDRDQKNILSKFDPITRSHFTPPTGFVSYNGIEYVIIGDDGTNIDIVPLPDDTNAITVSKDEASPIKAEDIMSKKYRNLPEEESNVG
jgi:hypothetical protein|tara:strand:- start:1697 stop:1963 length:267 start_codon:yes stop_codon:yes gene_type:complete